MTDAQFLPGDLIQVPSAAAMSQSLRSIGYTPETAIADLIDNSIAANAANVTVALGPTAGVPDGRLLIIDDGYGMSDREMLDAMRPGTLNPLDTRHPSDLGRFGLGLKTASFSQCRCLSVASRKNGGPVRALRWDLDHVGATNTWQLLEGAAPGLEADAAVLKRQRSGTIVAWTELDRLPGERAELLDSVRTHLGLVFHRFLERGSLKIRTTLDPDLRVLSLVAALDPFMRGHAATLQLPEEFLGEGCTFQGFVLPHHDRLTEEERVMGALGTSWRDRQGCYIYRNGRLVVAGGWLRLRKQWKRDVATQLARVRVDFSNVLDHEWKINVMKSTATPPAALRGRLQKLAKRVRRESEAVQVSRFKRVGPAPNRSAAVEAAQPVWMFRQNEGHSFTLNRHHPLVRSLYEMGPHARAVVRVVESSLPIAAIYEEVNRRFEEDGALHTQDPEELVEELHAWLVHQVSEGVALKEEVSRLKRTQPFDAMPGIVDSTAERVATESGLEFTGDEGDD